MLNNLNYFGSKILTIIVLSISSMIGLLGACSELSKIQTIKGLDYIGLGSILFAIWLFLYLKFKNTFLNFLTFLLFIIGIYSIMSGILSFFVSIFYNSKEKEN